MGSHCPYSQETVLRARSTRFLPHLFSFVGAFPGFYIGANPRLGHVHTTLLVFKIDSFSAQQEYLDELVVMLAPEPGSANPDHPQRGLDLEIHFSTSIKKVRHDRVERAV